MEATKLDQASYLISKPREFYKHVIYKLADRLNEFFL